MVEKKPADIFWMAVYMGIEGYSVDKLADLIIECGDSDYIKRFAKEVPGAPKEKLMKKYNEIVKNQIKDFEEASYLD